MPCCSAEVTLRRSRRGTRFFAHKAVGACATAPETEAHLRLKQIAVEAARACGWEAATEIAGRSPAGEAWQADVLARRGNLRVAIEIQWSAQTGEESLRRQALYAASGVRGLWLFRHANFPTLKALPAARIQGGVDEGFTATLGDQVLPVEDFLGAAFQSQLRFGLPVGMGAGVSVRTGEMSCWSCGADTEIITGLDVAVGPRRFSFTVPDLTNHRALFDELRQRLPNSVPIGAIRERSSRTQGRTYLSNGCSHCAELIGEHYEHEVWDHQQVVAEISVTVDESWARLIGEHHGEELGWSVYSDRSAHNG